MFVFYIYFNEVERSLCTFVRFETMIWPRVRFDISLQNFKKPSDSLSPQIERKRSKEYLVIILTVKESFERFSCLEFIFEKRKYREAGLKHKLKLWAWRLRVLRDTLILVFVNEKCCLCICFTELYFFYWLLVVSLIILFAVPFVFSRSESTSLAGVLKLSRVSSAFKDYTSIKPLNKK